MVLITLMCLFLVKWKFQKRTPLIAVLRKSVAYGGSNWRNTQEQSKAYIF